MTLVLGIDPGHGGWKNPGCVYGSGSDKLTESNYVLDLGTQLYTSLQGMPVQPVLTRTTDELTTFKKRGERTQGCDFVLCLHVNANLDHEAYGLQVYYPFGSDRLYSVALDIVDTSHRSLVGRSSRAIELNPETGWMRNARNVVGAHSHTDAILVEVGFASNKDNRRVLMTKYGTMYIINALRNGIVRYMELTDK